MQLRNRNGSDLFAANSVVVRLRDPKHEAAIAKIRRQLESSTRREATWGPVFWSAAAGAAMVALGVTCWAALAWH